jgi:DNA replication and repair protein RecF
MHLKSLYLRQFRNYLDQSVDFLAPKTILVGDNAQGKSNLLEAVELLATLRSHRVARDRDLVLAGEATAQITATLERSASFVDLGMTLRTNGRRTVTVNQEPLRRQLDFLGNLNAVQFSCLDLDLVRSGPDARRTWLDTLLMQLEPVYAHILQQYYQVLRQRNALLKGRLKGESYPESQPTEELAVWDAQLVATGIRVIRRRSRVLERLTPIAHSWHRSISGRLENLEIHYAPNLNSDTDEPDAIQHAFFDKLQSRSIAEHHQGTTLVGPHRDDIEFKINQTPARQFASQGQQRTLVLALKLAELTLIEEVVGDAPLLLLDDVLAELDLNRQNQLLETIQNRVQTLITTTHLGSFDSEWLRSAQVLTVQTGKILETAA